MKAMNAVITTGNVDAIAAVWKAFAPMPPSPPEGSIKPHRQSASAAPKVQDESVPINSELSAVGIEPDAEPSDAPPSPKPEPRGAGGKAKKQKAHNQPPEYKKPTKKELKEAKPPVKLKSFQAFLIVQNAELTKQGVTWASPADRMKELAARWKELEYEEKEAYREKALELDEQRHEEWMAKQ